jgi:hypothetical protein
LTLNTGYYIIAQTCVKTVFSVLSTSCFSGIISQIYSISSWGWLARGSLPA